MANARVALCHYIRFLCSVCLLPGPVAAQERETSKPPPQTKSDDIPASDSRREANDEIIVVGRPADDPTDLVRTISPSVTNWARKKYEQAEIFSRCMRKDSLHLLRDVIDAPRNKMSTIWAQDMLVRVNIACRFPNPFPPPRRPRLGYSKFEYGAILETVIRTYAPNLKLTREQTSDPEVKARFNEREVPLNRFRSKEDYRFFEVAVCMVRLEPKLSVQLIQSEPGSLLETQIQEQIILGAHICAGYAKRVVVDPTLFRIYIADSVYRWAVAARGTNSLLPKAS